MNWLDILLILVVIGVAALEMFRGFGRAIFDALFLYAALFGASVLSLPLAQAVHFHSGAAINHGYAYTILFVVLGAFSLALSRFIYGLTHMHTGMFEGMLGLCAGIAAGVMLCHGIVRPIAMADPDGKADSVLVTDGAVGGEMLNFTSYHSVLDTITGAASYRRELPNMDGKSKV